MTSPFKKAERSQVRLKLGITGPSGSGKTLGALALAREIVGPEGKIAFVDTENGSASLYSDRFDFDTIDIAPPYESKRFEVLILAAAKAEYDAIVIDSLSHQWAGDGGILVRKEQADKRGGNHFTNWAPFTKEHEQFKAALLGAPIHLIGCMRTKQDYVIEEGGGKSTPKKVGTAPIQREGMEYEFSVVFDVQMDHRAKASKDRTDLFGDELVDLVAGGVGTRLLAWQQSAKPIVIEWASPAQIAQLLELSKTVGGTGQVRVEQEIEKGITAAKATEWVPKLEAAIRRAEKGK